jgi:hypothetical protein
MISVFGVKCRKLFSLLNSKLFKNIFKCLYGPSFTKLTRVNLGVWCEIGFLESFSK